MKGGGYLPALPSFKYIHYCTATPVLNPVPGTVWFVIPFLPCYTPIVPEATIILLFATSFVVAFSGALMPGPLLVLTIKEVARRGFWAGPLLVLGHGLVEVSLVIALILGLNQLIKIGPVSGIIGIAGGIVLIWMGLATIKRGWRKIQFSGIGSISKEPAKALVLSGVLGSVSNPYFLIWWATIGIAYLLWSLKLGVPGVAAFYGGHILADLGWYALVAFVLARGKKVMNDTAYRWLLLTCGFALAALGGYFIVSGVRLLSA